MGLAARTYIISSPCPERRRLMRPVPYSGVSRRSHGWGDPSSHRVSAIKQFDGAVPIDLTHGSTDETQLGETASCLASRSGGNRGAVT
jgi:hypothetical protein